MMKEKNVGFRVTEAEWKLFQTDLDVQVASEVLRKMVKVYTAKKVMNNKQSQTSRRR